MDLSEPAARISAEVVRQLWPLFAAYIACSIVLSRFRR